MKKLKISDFFQLDKNYFASLVQGIVLCCARPKAFTPTCNDLACIAVTRNKQVHERKQGHIRGGGRKVYVWWRYNTFTLMKHKHKGRTHLNDTITIIIMQCCNDFNLHRFIKCMGEWEAAKDQGSFRLQTSLGRSYCIYNVKGTAYSSKWKSFALSISSRLPIICL